MISENLEKSIEASLQAGKSIRHIYERGFASKLKDDQTPVTEADLISNQIINDMLGKLNYPIISEEGIKIDYKIRKEFNYLWIVDPLDGTKEFINKTNDFTVNIALIENHIPILGVVYAPASKELYFAEKGYGSFKIEAIENFKDFKNLKHINLLDCSPPIDYTIVVSRSHLNQETTDYVSEKKQIFENITLKKFGSSLKICKVAEGKANCYPRLGPTMEWDTAAAHAVVKYSGKSLLKFNSTDELTYNKESLLNPFFVAE